MSGYAPAAIAALILGLGIGIVQNVMTWDSGVLFAVVWVAVLVVGALAAKGVPADRGEHQQGT